MKTITLEEHFLTASFIKATGGLGPGFAATEPLLLNLGADRIAAMDEAGIDQQVLSLVSMGIDRLDGPTATSLLADVNDELAAAIKQHPTRFAGFAALSLKEPAKAAQELERCVNSLGFCGTLIDGTTDGLFYDHPSFLPIFEAAAALNVPVYLHPGLPPEPVREAYFSGLTPEVSFALSIAGWGWHAEMGLHTLRLICSGLFDRLPTLQLIIGHMGEGLPYALARSSAILSRTAKLRQPVADYFKSNIHITTSGYFTQPPLRCAIDVVGLDRLMYSVDYPFSPNTRGQVFLSELKSTFTPPEMDQFTYGNAQKLLRLK